MNRICIIFFAFFVAIVINLLLPTKIDYHGPNSNIIKHDNFKKDDTCYKMKPKIIECP